MAQEATFETLNKNAERAVEQTVKQTAVQTRGALDSYFDFLQKAVSSFPSDETALGGKMKSFTEQNVAAAKKFVDELSQAKDFQQVIRIQAEYMQAQLHAFVEQTQSLSEEFTKMMTSEMKMPFRNR
jgi:hypothetical protein